jgi:hypothetical protein
MLLVMLCVPALGANDRGDAYRVRAFHRDLEAGGFIVNEGSTAKSDLIEMCTSRIMDSAAGNNAGQPYKRFMVPSYIPSRMKTRLTGKAGCSKYAPMRRSSMLARHPRSVTISVSSRF